MHPLRCCATLVAALVLVVAAAPATAGESADAAAIRAGTREWIAAFKAHDLDALMKLYLPEAQVALHGQPKLVGREAVREYFRPALAARPQVEFLLDIEEIRVHGRTAHLLSRYWFTSTPASGGEPYRDAGRSLLIYRKDTDGRWKILVDIDQATPDAQFPPPPQSR